MEIVNLCIFGILLVILLICLGNSSKFENKLQEGYTDVAKYLQQKNAKYANQEHREYMAKLQEQGLDTYDQNNSSNSASNINNVPNWNKEYHNNLKNADGLGQGHHKLGAHHRGNSSSGFEDPNHKNSKQDGSYYLSDNYARFSEKYNTGPQGQNSSNMDDIQDKNQNTSLIGGCGGTQFGCCDDGYTAASGQNGEGCGSSHHGRHGRHGGHRGHRGHEGDGGNEGHGGNEGDGGNEGQGGQNEPSSNQNRNNSSSQAFNSGSMPGSIAPGAQGLPKSDIPKGQEDMYILRSQIIPPVCPACPPVLACPKKGSCPACPAPEPVPPCPPCARCPEPAFTCKKVPDYKSESVPGVLPRPILNDFSQFRLP